MSDDGRRPSDGADRVRAARIATELDLRPHPEGGSYRETFRSDARVVDARGRERSALTIIDYLLVGDECSTWHRLDADETWHFASGTALALETIDTDGRHDRIALGPGGVPYAVVRAGTAFAARVADGTGFALVTCCVAPGFAFEGFELLDPAALVARYPAHAEAIARFAPSQLPPSRADSG